MKTWKATGCVLLAGIFWGSMGLFVRQLNAAGLYAIDVMQLRVLPSAIFVGLSICCCSTGRSCGSARAISGASRAVGSAA